LKNDAAVVARCREHLRTRRAELHAAYLSGKGTPAALLRGGARLIDHLLRDLWGSFAPSPDMALVAVGGYGRGEQYPASDVDVLFLLPEAALAQHGPALERLIGLLWDTGLEIGHSVRTIEECLIEAERDITVATALLESRYLCGNRALFLEFASRFQDALDPLAFFKAKRLEQEDRYAKHNDTPYNLEPNCKETPGGLRDLHIILWVARAAGLADRWSRLADALVVSRAESRQMAQAEDFLRRVRINLHLLTGRREDRLLFDHQESLAQQMGFAATASRRASEVLMQHYYRNAKRVTQLNTLVLLDISVRLEPRPPEAPIVIDEHFQMVRELLDIRAEDLFDKQPGSLLKGFLLLSQRPELKGMTPRSLRAAWRARHRIDAAFRRDPANQSNFLALFRERRGLTHQLRRMNQFDILGAYLPAFGRIVGRMQHDLFHVYTVDQHILQVVRNLRRFSLPEFTHEYPYCSRLMATFPGGWRLCVAALFHDIAKGRGGDHSLLGMKEAARFCRTHGIGDEDSQLIVFLVEHHLTLSSFAQKQDLADPEVIRRFAGIVLTEERLTALYLLTVADIRGTSPKVWNAWKSKLLEDLYRATRTHLAGDRLAPLSGLEARMEDARRLLRLHGLPGGIETGLWEQLDTSYFLRHDSEEISWHALTLHHRVAGTAPVVRTRINPGGAGLQVMIYTPDQSEIFARLCGFFARLGYSIVDAKIHTTRHGYALDSFILLDPENQMPYRDMIGIIDHELSQHLETRPPLPSPVPGRVSRQVRHCMLTPEVSIRPDESGKNHVLSITAADRSGLLYAIARVLASHDIRLSTAKITTLGDRIEDSFLISGTELEKTATLVRLEQELLDTLRIN